MKKLFLGIAILSFIVFTTTAMAAAPKVPKNLCYTYSTGYYHHQLLLKPMGTVPTSNGNVKMYTIIGNDFSGGDNPIHGTGYVEPGTTIFHATLNWLGFTTTYLVASYELLYNLESKTGNLYYRYDRGNGTIDTYTDTATTVDCKTLVIED